MLLLTVLYSTECLDPRDISIITSGWTNDKEKRATKYIMHIAHELEDHSTFLYTLIHISIGSPSVYFYNIL
jgi:hypothetical protein